LTLFHASCSCILTCIVHVPTLVAVLSMNMFLTVDRSSLGHVAVLSMNMFLTVDRSSLGYVAVLSMNMLLTVDRSSLGHVAVLSMNMLPTVDHSSLGHDVVHLGKNIPKFWAKLLFVFRLNTNSWMSFLAVTQCGLINRHHYFKGTCCLRLLHRRIRQKTLPKH
jgi:hypothetical protein